LQSETAWKEKPTRRQAVLIAAGGVFLTREGNQSTTTTVKSKAAPLVIVPVSLNNDATWLPARTGVLIDELNQHPSFALSPTPLHPSRSQLNGFQV